MAAIMDEWAAINQQVNKIGKALGVQVPSVLYQVEGSVFGRQAQRLNALSHFLKEVAGVVSETNPHRTGAGEAQTEVTTHTQRTGAGEKPKKGEPQAGTKSALKAPPKVIENNPQGPSLPKKQTDV